MITVIGANGVQRDFEFDSNGSVSPGRIAIKLYRFGCSRHAGQFACRSHRSSRRAGCQCLGQRCSLDMRGERLIRIDPALVLIDVAGKTIFVDKSAGQTLTVVWRVPSTIFPAVV